MSLRDRPSSSSKIVNEILKDKKKPMTENEIVKVGFKEYQLEQVLRGKTPHLTIRSNIIKEIKRRKRLKHDQRFARVSPAHWGLVEYLGRYYKIEEGIKQPGE